MYADKCLAESTERFVEYYETVLFSCTDQSINDDSKLHEFLHAETLKGWSAGRENPKRIAPTNKAVIYASTTHTKLSDRNVSNSWSYANLLSPKC